MKPSSLVDAALLDQARRFRAAPPQSLTPKRPGRPCMTSCGAVLPFGSQHWRCAECRAAAPVVRTAAPGVLNRPAVAEPAPLLRRPARRSSLRNQVLGEFSGRARRLAR